jgi:hypothetical protein
MIGVELTVAVLLVGSYFLFLTALFAVLWMRASRRRRYAIAVESQMPQVRDALVDYLAGSNDKTKIRAFVCHYRREVGDALLNFHGTVGGSARDRLCDLALEFSLVHDWCRDTQSREQAVRRKAYVRLSFVCAYEPCRRVAGDLLLVALNDSDAEVRLAAARALVESGTIEELGQVFRLAVSQSLLTRILLAEDLRRHATELCRTVVSEVLAKGNPAQQVAALQIVVAWECALPLENLHKLLESERHEVRLEALRLAPLVPLSAENRSAILRQLREGGREESARAALAAGRLRLEEAMPYLARSVRLGAADLAFSAATALAGMPPKGWQTLQEISSGCDASALIAAAALERGRRRAGV